jgi:hypothetical protein
VTGPSLGGEAPTRPRAWLPFLSHAILVLWSFQGSLLRGQLLFFRDISTYYFPNYVFLSRALDSGTWPLWNPACDAGAPFLMAEPLELLLVLLLGPRGALRFGPPLYVLLAMSGATVLARRLGQGSWGAWTAGTLFGLSGFVLSCLNLFELFHAVCWAPWVLAAYRYLVERPTPRRGAILGILGAVQLATLAGETVLQTALFALLLTPRSRVSRVWRQLLFAATLAASVAAPALLGARALLEGSRRAAGFDPEISLAWSVHPMVLLEGWLPRLFGNVHTFSEVGSWGQAYFPDRYPYLLSLYLGGGVLLLALRAGANRLWWAVGVGVALGLGAHGPLEPVLVHLMGSFRAPVKFLFLANLALCLLAGAGLERALSARVRARGWELLPGLVVLGAGVVLAYRPELPSRLLGAWLPELSEPGAKLVVATAWPTAFLVSGSLALGAGLALVGGRRLVPLAAVLASLDLLVVNAGINQTAAGFYDLRPAVADVVREASAHGRFRWFALGVVGASPLPWAPAVARHNSDFWLYYMDRQSLLSRAHVLDGLEGAFDEDRTGWAPAGSTLSALERRAYRSYHTRLRLGNVRWVLSFDPLPGDLVTPHDTVTFPEILTPLRLYEVRDALPRAFWVPRAEVYQDPALLSLRLADPAFDPRQSVLLGDSLPEPAVGAGTGSAPGAVEYESADPHVVRLRFSGPPGYIVVLDGYHEGWRAFGPEGEVPLLRANGRYRALRTSGGSRVYSLCFEPPWRLPALGLALFGSALAAGAILRRARRGA